MCVRNSYISHQMTDPVTARTALDGPDFNPWTSTQHAGQVTLHHSSLLEHHPSSSQHHPSSSHHQPSSSRDYTFSSHHHPSSSEHHPLSSQHHPASSEHHPASSQHHPSSTKRHQSSQNDSFGGVERIGTSGVLPIETDSSSNTTTPSELDPDFSRASFDEAAFHVSETTDDPTGLFASKSLVSKSVSDEVSQISCPRRMPDLKSVDGWDQMAADSPPECLAAGTGNRPARIIAAETTPQPSPSGPCHFQDRASIQALVRLSEDIRFYRLFYLVHAKCSSLSSRSFGPWCSKVVSKRSRKSEVFCSKSSKDLPSAEKIFSERLWQTSPARNDGATNRLMPNGASKDGVAPVKDKNAKNGDVFDRLSGQSPPHPFRHLADVRDYMSEYREHYTVGLVCRKLKRAPVLGVDVPDPYSSKKKNPCACIECSHRRQARKVTGAREGAGLPSGSSGCEKDHSSPDKQLARAVPNLAPVREKKTPRGPTPPADAKPTSPELPRPTSDPHDLPSLVLPSIQVQQESKRLTMIGRSAAGGPKETRAAFWTSHSDSNEEVGKDKTSNSEGGTGVKPKNRKKGPVKLKYTNCSSIHDASDVKHESKAESHKGWESSASLAQSAGKDGAVSPKITTAEPVPNLRAEKAREKGSHKEPWLPGLVRKGLTEEEPQRGLHFYRGRYATFTQAQKIYENKRTHAGNKRIVHGESRSSDKHQRLLRKSRRSRSVDVYADSGQDVRDRDWKTWISSSISEDGGGFLRVRVTSVDGLSTRLILDGKHPHVPSLERARRVPLGKISDSSAEPGIEAGTSETKSKENQVETSLPEKGQRDPDMPHAGTRGRQVKNETHQNSPDQEEANKDDGDITQSTKPMDTNSERMKQQKDFNPRKRREKNTSLKISQKVTNSPDSVITSEPIGIRGMTVTDPANLNLSNGSSRGVSTSNEMNSTVKESEPRTTDESQSPNHPDITKHEQKTSIRPPGHPPTRRTSLSNRRKNDKHLCDQKGTAALGADHRGGISLSSIYPGSLVITGGGAPEVDGTTTTADRKERKPVKKSQDVGDIGRVDKKERTHVEKCQRVGDAHPVTIEFGLPKEQVLSMDKKEPVAVVR